MKLGDRLARVTRFFGVKPCAACKLRQEALNLVTLSAPFSHVVGEAIAAVSAPELFILAKYTKFQPPRGFDFPWGEPGPFADKQPGPTALAQRLAGYAKETGGRPSLEEAIARAQASVVRDKFRG